MLMLVCRLTFSDGRMVTGKVSAQLPGTAYPIIYTGASECFKPKPDQGTPADLELIFRLVAQRDAANLTIERTGSYESRTGAIREGVRNSAASG
jgi:hypothetical protein